MSIAFRFTGILILALAGLAAMFGPGGSKPAAAAGESLDCSIPNHVVCEISHPDGIAHVTVTVDFGPELGEIDVVDQAFDCEQTVSVSWDSIVPNGYFSVVPCKGLDIKSPDDDGGRGAAGRLVLVERVDPRFTPTHFAVASADSKGGTVIVTATPPDVDKMEICHVLGNGKIKVMEIWPNAWPAHHAHGAGEVIGHIVGGGVLCLFYA